MPRRAKNPLVSKADVGQRVRALRLAQGMSQTKLADLLGITQSNVSGLERGARSLTIHQVVRLANALGTTTDELLRGVSPNGKDRGTQVQDRRFLRRLRQVDSLSKRRKEALLLTIDSFLTASRSD